MENNLADKVQTIRVAIDLMTGEDLSDKAHLEAYQTRMKQLYKLDKFAFVDTDGLIYTSTGTQTNIDEYSFDYHTLSQPEISVFHSDSTDKRVIIAIPVNIPFQGETLAVCFMVRFVQPDSIREGLKRSRVISYTYTVMRHGKESYETVRFAGVGRREDRDDQTVHNVGACFGRYRRRDAKGDGAASGPERRAQRRGGGQQGQDRIPLQHEP